MNKPHLQVKRAANASAIVSKNHQTKRKAPSFSCYSQKLSLFILASCVTLFILFQIRSIHTSQSPATSPSWPPLFIDQLRKFTDCTKNVKTETVTEKLRNAVTFLPLKDLRYVDKALQGHTWFMSSLYDTREEGEVQYQQFPSGADKSSHDQRVLCLKGRDTHDGSWNYYALAWPEALPRNATLMKGLTFVSYNHYDYGNIWHGLSAMVPFVAWHQKNNCDELPSRWVLYHWGELRLGLGLWLKTLMQATFDGEPRIEGFEDNDDDHPVCFEKAVVMRHNEGGMSRERRIRVYDLMRCKARMFCNVTTVEKDAAIGMTLFMRTGPRSFLNETAVIGIFQKECAKVVGCRIQVAYSNNLTFCEQVKLMSMTDILVSPHGAQLTNMFLMNRNSSVMEFFPKGWLKLAGVGQYVYHWIANWSGMRHQGAWRDPNGENCTNHSDDDRRCMSIYKNGRIGYDEAYFSQWSRNVLTEVQSSKLDKPSANASASIFSGCGCG